MTVQGPTEFIKSAEEFIDFIKPAAAIPMHYWSKEYKTRLLDHIKSMNNSGRSYRIEELNSAKYILDTEMSDADIIRIISLEPGSFNKNR